MWVPHVQVVDVAGTLARARELGGLTRVEPAQLRPRRSHRCAVRVARSVGSCLSAAGRIARGSRPLPESGADA
jgi:hypothetical protein